MKDNFSGLADRYATYRPTYPEELYRFLFSQITDKKSAWDCGTGNGQVARRLADGFERVCATDISRRQIDQAPPARTIHYSVQPAESTNFSDHCFDLITAAQSVHWFRFEPFYNEVKRTGRKGAILALFGYGRLRTFPEADQIVSDYYHRIVGPHWDRERVYVEQGYRTIPFPFAELKAPVLTIDDQWSLDQLIGYLGTWSATAHFINHQGFDPRDQIADKLGRVWGEGQRQISFPLFSRVGRIE